jgi:hypothetical protein
LRLTARRLPNYSGSPSQRFVTGVCACKAAAKARFHSAD